MEKLESTFAAYLELARESNASTDGTHLKDQGLHICAIFGLPMVRSADLTGDTTLFTEIYQVRAGVLVQKP
jgi:hypothetical protein